MQPSPIERTIDVASGARSRPLADASLLPQRTAAPRAAESVAEPSRVAIPSGGRFVGQLVFRGEAVVLGELRGDVVAQGSLWLGAGARVIGRIEVDELYVEGAIEGEVVARSRVELAATARVAASVETPRITVRDGGLLRGRLRMSRPADRRETLAVAPDSAVTAP